MPFAHYDENGKQRRLRVVIDCQKAIKNGEECRVEQAHKKETDINNIVKKHGLDLIQHTNNLLSPNFRFDDVTGNDFQEALEKINKAKSSFMAMPSEIRKQFDNNPAKFLDFVQDPDNIDAMVEMGLAERNTPPPIQQVEIVNQASISTPTQNPETPPDGA